MARNLVAMRPAQQVSTLVGARPALATDGVDITGWRGPGVFASPIAAVQLDGTMAASSITSPAGGAAGVELWGYVQAKWWLVGVLNNGVNVPIAGAGLGFAQEMDVIGIFERIAIAGVVSAGVVTAYLAPLDSYS